MKILDIGCGNNKLEGAIGIDKRKIEGVDIVHDLDKIPWPLQDNSFEKIQCHHVLEHVRDIVSVIHEIFRVAKNNATVSVLVPHFSCLNAYKDPTHCRYMSQGSFDTFFQNGSLVNEDSFFLHKKSRITFGSSLLDLPAKVLYFFTPRLYERRLAFIFPARNIEFNLLVKKGSTKAK